MSDNKKTPLPLEIMALELFGTVLMGTGIGMAGLPMGETFKSLMSFLSSVKP